MKVAFIAHDAGSVGVGGVGGEGEEGGGALGERGGEGGGGVAPTQPFGDGQHIQQQPCIARRDLREAAICRDQPRDKRRERRGRPAGILAQQQRDGEGAGGLRDGMVVVLRQGIEAGRRDPLAAQRQHRLELGVGVAYPVAHQLARVAKALQHLGHAVRALGLLLGAALVLGSAISYALYLSYSGQMVQRLGSLRLAGWATSVACVFCIGQFVLLRPLSAAQVAEPVLWLSLLNATACTAVPVVMVMMAIERIGSGLTAQTGMIGPMSTLLMGVLILDEPFNVWIVGGTLLVLSGVFWVTRAPKV